MAIIETELSSPSGARGPGHADVRIPEPRQRLGWAIGVGLGGISAGGLSILAPGAHLVLGCLAPTVGVVLGLAVGALTAWVRRVSGDCPACGRTFDVAGPGPVWSEAPQVPCPGCGAPLQVALPR